MYERIRFRKIKIFIAMMVQRKTNAISLLEIHTSWCTITAD